MALAGQYLGQEAGAGGGVYGYRGRCRRGILPKFLALILHRAILQVCYVVSREVGSCFPG